MYSFFSVLYSKTRRKVKKILLHQRHRDKNFVNGYFRTFDVFLTKQKNPIFSIWIRNVLKASGKTKIDFNLLPRYVLCTRRVFVVLRYDWNLKMVDGWKQTSSYISLIKAKLYANIRQKLLTEAIIHIRVCTYVRNPIPSEWKIERERGKSYFFYRQFENENK